MRNEDDERLEAVFDRFEALPARDPSAEKSSLAAEIVDALAAHASAEPTEHAPIEELIGRLSVTSPGAPGHETLVVELIHAAREHLADGHRHAEPSARAAAPPAAVEPPRRAAGEHPEAEDDVVDMASEESFPASDPPSYTADPDARRP